VETKIIPFGKVEPKIIPFGTTFWKGVSYAFVINKEARKRRFLTFYILQVESKFLLYFHYYKFIFSSHNYIVMDITLKFNLELILFICFIYAIVISHMFCSCCNVPKLIETFVTTITPQKYNAVRI